MPLCPFRNIDSVGHIDCGCKGKPEVYTCSHPETGDYCLLHAAGKPFQRILFKDGSEKRIGTAAERKEIAICSFCEHKPCPDDLVDPPKPPETAVQPPPPVPTAVVQPEKPHRKPVKLLKVEKRPEQPVQLPGLPPGAVVVDTFEEKVQLPVVLAEKKTPRILKTTKIRRIEQPKQEAAGVVLPPLSQQSTLSIVCADCNHPELGLFALEESLAVPHERALFFSHIPPPLLTPDIEWHYVPAFENINDYNLFVLRELHKHIATTHVLTVQHDGYVLHPDKWQEEWLDFDYIGAVWPADRRMAEFSRVGNSGFCLRSQRLLKTTAELATDAAIESHRAGWSGKVYDDVFTCHDSWHTLTAAGARFAPVDAAEAFAIERKEIDTTQLTTFGFHGKNAAQTIETESPDSRNDEEQEHEMFSLEQRETVLHRLCESGNCTVVELRQAANCPDCRKLLAEFETKHFVKKRWLNKAYRYAITDDGRSELGRLRKAFDILQTKSLLSPLSNLAAVTCYYNPQHSVNRRNNWFQFAEGLANQGIQLQTIEGVRNGDEPDLPDVPFVHRIRFRDVLWHKERLLNIAVNRLPVEYDAVAWLDADLLWSELDIADRILAALRRWPVIQPWATCCMLGPKGESRTWFNGKPIRSIGAYNRGGRTRDGDPRNSHPGFAWAARRETLEAIGGLYDRHISGAGDTAMAIAFFGDLNSKFFENDRMSPAMMSHWRAWAEKAYDTVRGNVGYIDAELRHLYHGELADRCYSKRWQTLSQYGYDPAAHVEHEPDGPLQWTQAASMELREWVENYLLHTRREDGR